MVEIAKRTHVINSCPRDAWLVGTRNTQRINELLDNLMAVFKNTSNSWLLPGSLPLSGNYDFVDAVYAPIIGPTAKIDYISLGQSSDPLSIIHSLMPSRDALPLEGKLKEVCGFSELDHDKKVAANDIAQYFVRTRICLLPETVTWKKENELLWTYIAPNLQELIVYICYAMLTKNNSVRDLLEPVVMLLPYAVPIGWKSPQSRLSLLVG